MKANMGSADKTIRIMVALVLVTLYFTDVLTGTTGTIALIVSVVFLLTSAFSFCPLYKLFGINTCKKLHA